ncbi:MAG: NADH-quinone oxidoreductase subunit A [Candidatus Alcyoniella australis]|nr:NADH-quinone oxidoreductase subunit A [Candidatus Alcyoniella australis]
MDPNTSSAFLPLFVYIGFVLLVVVGGIIGLTSLFGPRKPSAEKLSPYECGVPPVGSPRERFSIKFYVIGMLFLLFDLEVVFIYPWVRIYRQSLDGSAGVFLLVEMLLFSLVLVLGLVYAWRKGALQWD